MKLATVIVVASVLAAASCACIADANSDAKKAIQAAANKAMQHIMDRNYDAVAKMCTPDCTFSEAGQTMDLKHAMAEMKTEMAQMKDVKMASTVTSCTVKGNVATCMSHDTMSGTMMGPDKKAHKLTSDGIAKETFVKSGGTWLMKSNSTVSDKMTMDGKPFDPRAAAAAAAAAGSRGMKKK